MSLSPFDLVRAGAGRASASTPWRHGKSTEDLRALASLKLTILTIRQTGGVTVPADCSDYAGQPVNSAPAVRRADACHLYARVGERASHAVDDSAPVPLRKRWTEKSHPPCDAGSPGRP